MNTTYPINYIDSGFFSSDKNIIATFPFKLSSVIRWAQGAKNRPLTAVDAANIPDIFDSKLSTVITNPGNKDDFIDNFLPGNIYLNTNFSPLTVSTDAIAPANSMIQLTDVTINGTTYKGSQLTDADGSTSFLLGDPGKQRVVYQPVCTVKHIHFPKGCNVIQTINANNESYYSCSCPGVPVFDDSPHSHCSQFTNIATDGKNITNSMYNNSGGANSTGLTTTSGAGSSSTAGSGNKFNVNYEHADSLTQRDKLIRSAIYKYYCAVNDNLKYKTALQKNKALNDTSNQALMDSTVKYKTQYLNVFNILSGIILAGGYIYTLV
jgi:hypothetical protein